MFFLGLLRAPVDRGLLICSLTKDNSCAGRYSNLAAWLRYMKTSYAFVGCTSPSTLTSSRRGAVCNNVLTSRPLAYESASMLPMRFNFPYRLLQRFPVPTVPVNPSAIPPPGRVS